MPLPLDVDLHAAAPPYTLITSLALNTAVNDFGSLLGRCGIYAPATLDVYTSVLYSLLARSGATSIYDTDALREHYNQRTPAVQRQMGAVWRQFTFWLGARYPEAALPNGILASVSPAPDAEVPPGALAPYVAPRGPSLYVPPTPRAPRVDLPPTVLAALAYIFGAYGIPAGTIAGMYWRQVMILGDRSAVRAAFLAAPPRDAYTLAHVSLADLSDVICFDPRGAANTAPVPWALSVALTLFAQWAVGDVGASIHDALGAMPLLPVAPFATQSVARTQLDGAGRAAWNAFSQTRTKHVASLGAAAVIQPYLPNCLGYDGMQQAPADTVPLLIAPSAEVRAIRQCFIDARARNADAVQQGIDAARSAFTPPTYGGQGGAFGHLPQYGGNGTPSGGTDGA